MREEIYQWMKGLAVFYLFFTAVLQLVPDRKYERYVRSFMGLLLIYMLCTPCLLYTSPLITNEEHQKLSKRSGHSSYEDLVDQGFLTEAIVNFVALLGWSPQENREIYSLPELVEAFDYHHISKSPGCRGVW